MVLVDRFGKHSCSQPSNSNSLVHTLEQPSILSPGSLLDRQILRLHHRLTESEAQRAGPGISV